jgi:hypothetical protein
MRSKALTVLLFLGALVLSGIGLWLRTVTETVYWIGDEGGGTYQRPSSLYQSAGLAAWSAAVLLVVVGATRVRSRPVHLDLNK